MTARRSSSWSTTRTTTRSATAPSAIACRRRRVRSPRSACCSRRSCRCCSWARSTARTRPSSSSPTTSIPRSRRRRARVAGRSSPRSTPSTRSIPDPQDPETFERSRLTRRADPRLAALYRELLAVAAHARRRGAGQLRRGAALAARAPARRRDSVQLRRRAAPAAGRGGAPSCAEHTPGHDDRRRTAARSRWRRSRGHCSHDGGVGGAALPARCDLGRRGHQLLALLRARRDGRAVPVRRERQRDAPAPRAPDGAQLARLPSGRRPAPALRLPRPRPLRPRARAPLQPGQARARPLRQGDRRAGALGCGQRPPLRPLRRRERRSGGRRRGLRPGDAPLRRRG